MDTFDPNPATGPRPLNKQVPELTIYDECKYCAEGEPEWSPYAKCWIHRRAYLDKRCTRKRLGPCGELPEPVPQPTPAEPRIETVPEEWTAELPRDNRFHDPFEAGAQPEPEERAAWRKWFISEYGFPSSKLDDVSWAAWRARAGSSPSQAEKEIIERVARECAAIAGDADTNHAAMEEIYARFDIVIT